jgi:SAM-dependent methyltransferase
VGELKQRVIVLAGAALLSVVGRDRFYQMAQDKPNVLGRLAAAFCSGHAGRLGQNYHIYAENKDVERISAIALRYYGDDSLHGYGDVVFTRDDGKVLVDQQRGLVIPLVAAAVERDRPKLVLEIGTGNGDVIAHLAARHPAARFVGCDLSVKNAAATHRLSNLTFVRGYALDLLRGGTLSPDIVFASSTFCVFTPKELQAYLQAMRDVRRLIISDPVTFGNVHRQDTRPASRHMDQYMWWHNYFGYLTASGFRIEHFENRRFLYSWNPHARVVLIEGSRT